MHRKELFSIVIPWLVFTLGCSDSGSGSVAEPADTRDAATDSNAPPPPVGPLPTGVWSPLVEHSWQLEPGKEGYWCKRVTVAEDMYVQGLRTSGAKGIHHALFGVDSGPAGAFRCTGFSVGGALLFGTGAGGGQQLFPEGVALKLAAGESLLLNLHLFNTTTEALSNTVVIEALAVDPANVQHEAALVLAGAMGFEVVPGQSTVTGTCSIGSDTTILGAGQHMHLMGIHEKVTAFGPTGSAQVLVDAPYDFEDQRYFPADPPVVIPAGGHVQVECTYQNDTGQTVMFGESTNSEMCFSGLYHYPRIANGSTCTL